MVEGRELWDADQFENHLATNDMQGVSKTLATNFRCEFLTKSIEIPYKHVSGNKCFFGGVGWGLN